MTENTKAFDSWLRTRFVEINSELEKLYWQQDDKANVEGVGEHL
ncbi:monodechloroaminopyrrolnitrin synthase PrnB family protein, partial [uncultured Pseudoalteromonas sp.]